MVSPRGGALSTGPLSSGSSCDGLGAGCTAEQVMLGRSRLVTLSWEYGLRSLLAHESGGNSLARISDFQQGNSVVDCLVEFGPQLQRDFAPFVAQIAFDPSQEFFCGLGFGLLFDAWSVCCSLSRSSAAACRITVRDMSPWVCVTSSSLATPCGIVCAAASTSAAAQLSKSTSLFCRPF